MYNQLQMSSPRATYIVKNKMDTLVTAMTSTSESKKKDATQTITQNMDSHNAKAMNIMCSQGIEAGLKHMLSSTVKDADGKERPMTYSEMRYRYG